MTDRVPGRRPDSESLIPDNWRELAALVEVGYNGYLSAEILPLPDSDAAAKQTIESFRRYVC